MGIITIDKLSMLIGLVAGHACCGAEILVLFVGAALFVYARGSRIQNEQMRNDENANREDE